MGSVVSDVIAAMTSQSCCAPSIQLQVFDRIPSGFLAHAERTRDSLPLVEPGEVVVIDPGDREPAEGALFVIEWGRSTNHPTRCIIEMWLRNICTKNLGCADEQRADVWTVGAYGRPRTAEAARAEARRTGVLRFFTDGPYSADGDKAWYLPSLLIGRVIGIYRPSAGRIG